jgi:hypothetical protein
VPVYGASRQFGHWRKPNQRRYTSRVVFAGVASKGPTSESGVGLVVRGCVHPKVFTLVVECTFTLTAMYQAVLVFRGPWLSRSFEVGAFQGGGLGDSGVGRDTEEAVRLWYGFVFSSKKLLPSSLLLFSTPRGEMRE